MNPLNHYDVLGAEPTASHQELKVRFKQRIKETHPDKGGNVEEAERVIRAWKVLGDEELRKEYDIWLQGNISGKVDSTAMREAVSNRFAWEEVNEEGEVECPQCGEPIEREEWMKSGETVECVSCSSWITLE